MSLSQEQIRDGNKLIAEFMNRDGNEGNFYEERQSHLEANYHYHRHWVWLMPVVEKIEAMGYNTSIRCRDEYCKETYGDLGVNAHFVRIYNKGKKRYSAVVEDVYSSSKIQAIWLAIIAFILGFNQQKESNNEL